MIVDKSIRLRFAPSPTGLMHLGNVRTALMNYLFAFQKGGTFVLRIEDTDQQRTIERGVERIIEFLEWLHLSFDEGPFLQSERSSLYETYLEKLQTASLIYRCFCTPEDLEKRRERQIALKQPPRYDRTCLTLSEATIVERLQASTPFIWRVKLDHGQSIAITDLAHGQVIFELKNFSDFAITRADGTFTFLFANFVDDVEMRISHVVRGEDHLTNTACQAFLYVALGYTLPIFWHLPILCNAQGAKLSKRDFGFSLGDLQAAGFLPEAILNYLAISGGGSFEQEIMSLKELVERFDFTKIHSTGHIRYDLERLRWINHKWIERLSTAELALRVMPILNAAYPNYFNNSADSVQQIEKLLSVFKSEMVTLVDVVRILAFYFVEPVIQKTDVMAAIPEDYSKHIALSIQKRLEADLEIKSDFIENLKNAATTSNIPVKHFFAFVRIALTGNARGPAIIELLQALPAQEAYKRVMQVCSAVL